MAYTAIDIGSAANDGTGTPNRNAWAAANVMFNELYSSLSSFLTSADYNTDKAALALTLASLTTTITDKADASALVTKADKIAVPRFDITQDPALNAASRLKFAENIGNFISFPFEVLPPDINIGTGITFKLPRFANGFIIHDLNLSIDSISEGDGANYTASLVFGDGDTVAGSVTAEPLLDTLLIPLTVTSDRTIPAADRATLTVTTDAEEGAVSGFGLILWVRGAWAN